MTPPTPAKTGLSALPRGIWVLGLVSMAMDVSSEMIHALLPVYLVAVLGASTLTVGFIEGIAEATASLVKIVSGTLSDRLGTRKWLAVLGYGLAAFTKPIFPLAPSVAWVTAARFVDRIGKGIRGAPRDALAADIAPPDMRGAAFGLRQSLDTVGAFLGPFLAVVLMWASGGSYVLVFWVAVVPAFVAVALLVFGVEDVARPAAEGDPDDPVDGRVPLGGAFWGVVAVAAVFGLARFSEAFLVLKASAVGLPAALVPLVLVVMNVVYAIAAYPAGALSDKAGRTAPLLVGLAVLIAGDLALAFADGLVLAAVGVAAWGLHMGLTQGVITALVADAAPASRRGTAFGIFNFVTGVAALGASLLAGGLWDAFGAQATFLTGAGFAVLTALGVAVLRRARANCRRAGGAAAKQGAKPRKF
ncbi:MFS transporter [Pinisolibacter sp.]|uniref:MFS transporter n=1 Tax=Pinisolibacter sp. TaxID=2172024 RepID=UPI002FDD93B4